MQVLNSQHFFTTMMRLQLHLKTNMFLWLGLVWHLPIKAETYILTCTVPWLF